MAVRLAVLPVGFSYARFAFPTALGILVTLGMIFGVGCATSSGRFSILYDHYFPKEPESLLSDYRMWFDRTVFNPNARDSLAQQEQELFDAIRGDIPAFHKFLHSSYRESAGEFGETWVHECVLLLLVLGDERFATLLAQEDERTVGLVAGALNSQIEWRSHPFPRTRALVIAT